MVLQELLVRLVLMVQQELTVLPVQQELPEVQVLQEPMEPPVTQEQQELERQVLPALQE